jgi:hypothetical protein
MPSHYDEEIAGMDAQDITRKKSCEDYIADDPGTLFSKDLALEGMLIDPEQSTYGITQYELNVPRYGLSGRFSRTGEGRSVFEQGPVGRQQVQPDTETRPDTVQYGSVDDGLRRDDAGADAFEANLPGSITGGQSFDFDSPYGGYGSPEMQDFAEGDFLSTGLKGAGYKGAAGLAGLGINAAAMGMNPATAILSYGPQALAATLANPMTMGLAAGYVGNQAFDIAARGTEAAGLESGLMDLGIDIDSDIGRDTIGAFSRSRQSRTGIDRALGLAGLGSNQTNQDIMDDILSSLAQNTDVAMAQDLGSPTAKQELVDQRAQVMSMRAAKERAIAEQEARAQAQVASAREAAALRTAQPGGTFAQAMDWGFGFGTRQPTVFEYMQARKERDLYGGPGGASDFGGYDAPGGVSAGFDRGDRGSGMGAGPLA